MAGEAGSLGWAYVDPTTGKVRDGASEINATRDRIAELKIAVDARYKGVITRGTTNPLNTTGNDGDIYLKIVTT